MRRNFEELYRQPVIPSVQDEYLYNLCRPERLLQLMHFTLYDDGIKKVARYRSICRAADDATHPPHRGRTAARRPSGTRRERQVVDDGDAGTSSSTRRFATRKSSS
ncbi:MAG: hypothetical protein ACLR3T_00090 [Alistipes finegoldii]